MKAKLKQKGMSVPLTGGSSLLVIFAVLCLTIFAMLAVSTARADDRIADAAVSAVTGWYEADTEAEQILAQLRRGEMPASVTEEDGICSYSCSISDTQSLFVQVRVDGSDYEILQWQAVSTITEQPNEKLNVWGG